MRGWVVGFGGARVLEFQGLGVGGLGAAHTPGGVAEFLGGAPPATPPAPPGGEAPSDVALVMPLPVRSSTLNPKERKRLLADRALPPFLRL